MFLISLIYKKPLKEVEQYLPGHIQFLAKYYSKNKFIFSGRKVPRAGGIILAYNLSSPEVHELIKEDLFYQQQLADYDITEFVPTKFDEKFEHFVTE